MEIVIDTELANEKYKLSRMVNNSSSITGILKNIRIFETKTMCTCTCIYYMEHVLSNGRF